jgi:hypothetical protein
MTVPPPPPPPQLRDVMGVAVGDRLIAVGGGAGGRPYEYLLGMRPQDARAAVRGAFGGGGRDGYTVVCRSVYCAAEAAEEAPYAGAIATFRPAPRSRRRELVQDPAATAVGRNHFVAAGAGSLRVFPPAAQGDGEPLAELAFATALFSGPLPCARLRAVFSDPVDGCSRTTGGGGSGGSGSGADAIGSLAAPRAATVVARGQCYFHVKARVAQDAGAAALIVVNSDAAAPARMPRGGDSAGDDDPVRDLYIPAVMISRADGGALRGLAAAAGSAGVWLEFTTAAREGACGGGGAAAAAAVDAAAADASPPPPPPTSSRREELHRRTDSSEGAAALLQMLRAQKGGGGSGSGGAARASDEP